MKSMKIALALVAIGGWSCGAALAQASSAASGAEAAALAPSGAQPARIPEQKAAHSPHAASTDPPCRPNYPAAAGRARAVGVTRVRGLVSAEGKLVDVEILHSAGTTPEHQLLDDETLRVVRACSYVPGTDEQGGAVRSTFDWTLTWRLE